MFEPSFLVPHLNILLLRHLNHFIPLCLMINPAVVVFTQLCQVEEVEGLRLAREGNGLEFQGGNQVALGRGGQLLAKEEPG